MKSATFISTVIIDSERCKEAIETNENVIPLLNELIGKYSEVSANFPKIDANPLLLKMQPTIAIGYLQRVQGFLNMYVLNDCEDYRFDDTKSSGINVIAHINNTNTNSNENRISISFSDAREKAEQMDALSESAIQELISKINEIEAIVNSSDRKSKKWEKASEIIKWVLDKGFDVAMVILPLILKLQ